MNKTIKNIYEDVVFELILFAFVALGIENIIKCIEKLMNISLINGINIYIHYGFIIIAYILTCILLIKHAKRNNLDILGCHNEIQNNKLSLMLLIIVLIIAFKYYVYKDFELIINYQNINYSYESNSLIIMILEIIKKLAYISLIVIILALGQKLGENYSSNIMMPYGGIVLALTYGISNFISISGYIGIYSMIVSIGFGYIYLICRKNAYKAYLLIALLMII